MAKREKVVGAVDRARVSGPAPLDHIAEGLRKLAVKVADLTPDPTNARRHDARNIQAIEESLHTFGQRAPIVAQRQRDGSLVVRAGNGRLRAAQRLGWEMIAVVEIAEGDDVAAAFALADNRTAELASWDDEQLAANLSALRGAPELFGATGYKEAELDDLLAELAEDVLRSGGAPPSDDGEGGGGDGEGDDEGDGFEEAERERATFEGAVEPEESAETLTLPTTAITQPGDLWLLGPHRLLCGDSTRAEDVARLLDGERINVAFTSPPYASQRAYDESSGFKPIHPDDYVEWFAAIQDNVARHLAEDGSWFVNIKEHSEGGARHLYVKDLTIAHVRKWGWSLVDELCWLRQAMPGDPASMRKFKNGWEPVFHFARGRFKFNPKDVRHTSQQAFDYQTQKAAGKNISAASQGVGGNAQSPVGQGEGLAYPSNVLDIKEGARVVGHAAAFPVKFPMFFIVAYSDKEDLIFDPFLGSGTTLLAADMAKRRCVGLEISPSYCDLIVKRWESMTGLAAKRVSSGEPG